ncbi:unnamed protein product [Phytomonas sp. Hart1]|nr:unnamed protein product [Phytomonas sp. Hart1]|eukprot:CCW68442.1 unnamed protein product [Phytomonas sp. isolate Hart1]
MGTFISLFKDSHAELLKAIHWDDILLSFTQSEKSSSLWEGFLQEMNLFYHSVNWSEPFFAYLAVFHIVIIVFTVYKTIFRPYSLERLFAFSIFLLILAFGALPLNRIGRKYGKLIFRESGVNYFDESGIFLTLLYWVPLVFHVVWIEICIIVRASLEIARLKPKDISRQSKSIAESNKLRNRGIKRS